MWQRNHTLWVKFGTHDFKLLKLETNMKLNTKQTYLNDQNTAWIKKNRKPSYWNSKNEQVVGT